MEKEKQKPSDRIKEILNEMDSFLAPEKIAQAIMHYLDEEHKKKRNLLKDISEEELKKLDKKFPNKIIRIKKITYAK